MRRGRRPTLVIGAVALLGVLSVVWYVNRDVPKSLAYWTVDDRTIGVQATDGPRVTCWLAGVTETAADVTVDVECHPGLQLGPATSEGHPYDFVVTLAAPLGQRRVIDALGLEAVLCVAPRCGMDG